MPCVASPLLDGDVADLRALAEEYLGRTAAVTGLRVVLGDVFVEIVETRVAPGDDQGVGQYRRTALAREVLTDDRFVDGDAVGNIEEDPSREESRVSCGETLATGLHDRKQPSFAQIRILL